MLSLIQFHQELTGDASQIQTTSDDVVLLLDRSLSPAGARRLRDRRCQGFTAGGEAWPNPGVYALPEFALRLLSELERRQQRLIFSAQTLSPIQAIAALMQSPTGKLRGPLEAWTLWRSLKHLAPLGVSFEDWRQILPQLEQGDDPDFQIWTDRILAFLQIEALAGEQNCAAHDWAAVNAALQCLASETFNEADWERILERPPSNGRARAFRLLVPTTCDQHPLEAKFLRALARHLPVIEMKALGQAPEAAIPPVNLNLLSEAERTQTALHWASTDTSPAASEAAELLPGEFALDVTTPPPATHEALCRALCLFCDYLDESRPESHRYRRGDSATETLRRAGIDPDSDFTVNDLWQWIGQRSPSWLRTLPTLPEGPRGEWARVLIELGALGDDESQELSNTSEHPRFDPRGMPVLSWGDLGLTGHSRLMLWGKRESIRALCNPESPENFSRRIFPAQLASLLNAAGYAVADTAEEARIVAAWLRDLGSRLTRLEPTRETPRHSQVPPRVAVTPELEREYSPTALESYFACSFRYLMERRLRLQAAPEWDAPGEDPLSMGLWLHKALELFFQNPDWNSPHARVLELLHASLDDIFAGRATSAYRDILRAGAANLAQQLGRHIEVFERPLLPLRGDRMPQLETPTQGSWGHLRLRGKIDRVDTLPDGARLLWDYKSGDVGSSIPKTQIRNGRFQWFLYRALLEQSTEHAPVVGGGYLNPLRPDKSSLFVWEGHAQATHFAELFARAGHTVRVLSEKDLTETQDALAGVMDLLQERIRHGEASPQPLKASLCTRCSVMAVCGRPQLIDEESP